MNREKRQVLIPLAVAHVTQLTNEDGSKTLWEVQENKTNDLLAEMPSNFTDKEMFKVLNFARKFELSAFNIGMKYMNSELTKERDIEKSKLLRVIKELEIANSKLAEKLETFIGEEITP